MHDGMTESCHLFAPAYPSDLGDETESAKAQVWIPQEVRTRLLCDFRRSDYMSTVPHRTVPYVFDCRRDIHILHTTHPLGVESNGMTAQDGESTFLQERLARESTGWEGRKTWML